MFIFVPINKLIKQTMAYDSNIGDFSLKPKDYYEQTRAEMLEFIPTGSKKILDIGCGKGEFSILLKKQLNAEVWGIEFDDASSLEAQKKIDKVLSGDINKHLSSLPDAYFDCIVFNDVLEHLIDPYYILNEIKNKLTSSGVVVASIPNVRYITNIKKLLIDKQWKYEDAGILDKTHLRFFTKKSIIDMFTSLGYEVIVIEGINPIRTWKFGLLNFLSFGWLADTKFLQFACVAKPG